MSDRNKGYYGLNPDSSNPYGTHSVNYRLGQDDAARHNQSQNYSSGSRGQYGQYQQIQYMPVYVINKTQFKISICPYVSRMPHYNTWFHVTSTVVLPGERKFVCSTWNTILYLHGCTLVGDPPLFWPSRKESIDIVRNFDGCNRVFKFWEIDPRDGGLVLDYYCTRIK